MTVGEAKSKIPATEFIRWLVYFERDLKKTTKQDYYLAQIAKIVWDFIGAFSTWAGVKDFEFKPLKEFLIDFDASGEATHADKKTNLSLPPGPTAKEVAKEALSGIDKLATMTPEAQERMAKSQSMWFQVLGNAWRDGQKNKKKKPTPGKAKTDKPAAPPPANRPRGKTRKKPKK